jgi:TrmH family RNA methyltransferase
VSSKAEPKHYRQVIEDVRRASTRRGREALGAFAVEGRRLVERGIRAGWVPRDLLVATGERSRAPELEGLLGRVTALGGRCHEVPDGELRQLAEGRQAGLVSALFPLPPALAPSELWAAPRSSMQSMDSSIQPRVYLVLVDVVEPGNVGALIRTALASGAHGAICVGDSDPFHSKAVRTSLGSLFKLPLARVASGDALIGALRERGVHSLATVARGGVPLDRAVWPTGDLALLVGNEGAGLPDRVRDAADQRVTIELSTQADSFCVNAAAAVCLYEVQRRRRFQLDFDGGPGETD